MNGGARTEAGKARPFVTELVDVAWGGLPRLEAVLPGFGTDARAVVLSLQPDVVLERGEFGGPEGLCPVPHLPQVRPACLEVEHSARSALQRVRDRRDGDGRRVAHEHVDVIGRVAGRNHLTIDSTRGPLEQRAEPRVHP